MTALGDVGVEVELEGSFLTSLEDGVAWTDPDGVWHGAAERGDIGVEGDSDEEHLTPLSEGAAKADSGGT